MWIHKHEDAFVFANNNNNNNYYYYYYIFLLYIITINITNLISNKVIIVICNINM